MNNTHAAVSETRGAAEPTRQSYAHHVHHPVPTYVANVLLLAALACFGGASWLDWKTRDAGLILLGLAVFTVIGIGRLYTVKLQDRIVRLEMRVRCSRLLPSGQDELLSQLSTKQVVALRFASDQELGQLLGRAVREPMTPDAIKKAIRHWNPDNMRT